MKKKTFKKYLRRANSAAAYLRTQELPNFADSVSGLVAVASSLEKQVRAMVKSEAAMLADIRAVFAALEKREQKGRRVNLLAALEQIRYIVEGDDV